MSERFNSQKPKGQLVMFLLWNRVCLWARSGFQGCVVPEVAPPERMNTPPSIPLASDEQKNKTVERCLLSPVQDGPKSSWRVRFEICNCHLTTGDKAAIGVKMPSEIKLP